MSTAARFTCLFLAALAGACTQRTTAEHVGTSRSPIVGGVDDTEDPAVVEVLVKGEGECTGTLIAPAVVLTAAHCITDDPAGPFAIFTGPDDANRAGGDVVKAKSVHVHPDYDKDDDTSPADIAVMVLERPLAIAPIPYNKQPLGTDLWGKPARMVGYGDNTVKEPTAGFGKRRQATSPLIKATTDWVRVGTKQFNQCYGDSGGPVLMTIDGVEVVVGVDSYQNGDDCDSWNDNTRVDTFLAFIDPIVAANAGTTSPSSTSALPSSSGTTADGGRNDNDPAGERTSEADTETETTVETASASCGLAHRSSSSGGRAIAIAIVLGALAITGRRRSVA